MNKDNWDYYSTMKTATDKAKAEGRAEGRAEGKATEKIATAKRLKAMGLDVQVIAEATQLTPDVIQNL